jgi:hypothetical protein
MSVPLDVAKVTVFTHVVAAAVSPVSDVAVNRAVVRPSGTTSGTEGGKAQKTNNQDDGEDSKDAVGGFVLSMFCLASHETAG